MAETPGALGLYQRYMARGWDERELIGVPTLFQRIFARNGETVFSDSADVLDIEVIRANGERTAALIPRGGITRSLGSLQVATHEQKFTSVNRVFPLSVELYDISASQLNKRLMGEPLYQPWSREKRLRKLAAVGMRETVKRTARMFEVLAAQAARTGKQDAILGEATPSFDFKRNANNTITVSVKWDASSPTILADIDDALDALRQNGHMRGNVMLAGADALDAAIHNSDFQTIADNRRFGFIQLGDQPLPSQYQWLVDGGADARGWILTPKGRKVWVFTYDEGYTNSGGTYTPYMPVDECLLFATAARCDRYFGPPETLPPDSAQMRFYADRFGMAPNSLPPNTMIGNVIMPQMLHFDAYGDVEGTAITHRTQSAPVFATIHVDGFALLDGCV